MPTKLQYISSSGGQYIDTGILATNVGRIVLDCEMLATPGSWGCAFGSQGSWYDGSLTLALTWTNSRFNFRRGSGSNQIGMISSLNLNQRYLFDCYADMSFYVDETLQGTRSPGSVSSQYTVCLFANNADAGIIQNVSMRLYAFRVYDTSNNLIADYVPYLDGQGEVCVYDEVTGAFKYNLGSGSFDPGPPELITYTVQFNANGGTGTMADQRIETGASVALEDNAFAKSGYLFKGWDISSAGTTVVYTDGQTVTDLAQAGATVTLYAVWGLAWAYLLKGSDNKLYTMDASQNLTEVTGVSTLTKAVFLAHGFQTTPTTATLESLGNPTIYKWDALNPPTLQAKVSAVPYPQPIKTVIDLSGVQITGIQALEATYSGNVNACYSYDGTTYTTETTLASFLAMDKDALYAGLGASKMLYFNFILTDENATLTSFKLTYKRRPFAP